MKRLIICPHCNHEVEAIEWEDGECKCGNKYKWDEQGLPEDGNDWADSWVFVTWELMDGEFIL